MIMRECAMYFAYDGTEFFDRVECEEYEKDAMDRMDEIDETYEFLDEDKKPIEVKASVLEERLDGFNSAWNDCAFVIVKKAATERVMDFVYDFFGFFLPEEAGTYRYWYNGEEWHKVDG